MSHEPECPAPQCFDDCDICRCDCDGYRAAYQRGREDAAESVNDYMRKTYGLGFSVEEQHIISLIRGEGEQA